MCNLDELIFRCCKCNSYMIQLKREVTKWGLFCPTCREDKTIVEVWGKETNYV